MSEELRPCPLCSGKLRLVGEKSDKTYDCDTCFTTFYVGFDNPKGHINNRPIEDALNKRIEELESQLVHQIENKNQAYLERNMLVAVLAKIFPSGIAKTDIEGWNSEWLNCVYIDGPFGQASWHYHDSQTCLFNHLPTYIGKWDGHTTDDKYRRLLGWAKEQG